VNSSRPANTRIDCRKQRLVIGHHPRSSGTIRTYDATHRPRGQPEQKADSPRSVETPKGTTEGEPRENSNLWKRQEERAAFGRAGAKGFAALYPCTVLLYCCNLR
jgi:hypothetical protein